MRLGIDLKAGYYQPNPSRPVIAREADSALVTRFDTALDTGLNAVMNMAMQRREDAFVRVA